MSQGKFNNWDLVHKAATRAVNSMRARFALSNADAEDLISSLTVEFLPRAATYRPSEKVEAGTSLETWLIRGMILRAGNMLTALRSGGTHDHHAPKFARFTSIDKCDLPADEPGTDAQLDVSCLLDRLSQDDRILLADYYGLGDEPPQSAAAIADRAGVAQSTVQRRLARIINSLRA